jgi:hypothetical protein
MRRQQNRERGAALRKTGILSNIESLSQGLACLFCGFNDPHLIRPRIRDGLLGV